MKIHSLLLSCALSFAFIGSIEALDCRQSLACCEQDCFFRHQAFIGPEVYAVRRSREGGTLQTGCLAGARVGYDYIRRYAFYFGIDGLYAEGTLKGSGSDGERLQSRLVDANVEGRVGYTFETKNESRASFTPFLGIGYFWEYNDYQHPSPLRVCFKNKFYYVPVGFLSRFFINPRLSLGLNVKARFLIDGQTKVTNDSEIEEGDLTLHYDERVQYRIDLPLTYCFCLCEKKAAISVVPFYEYRQYGHRTNFPFDFLETTFNLYGATIRLYYLF